MARSSRSPLTAAVLTLAFLAAPLAASTQEHDGTIAAGRGAERPVPRGPVPRSPEERAARVRETAPALAQAPVDFNHPPREYLERKIEGWPVRVERQLADESPELARRALARLEEKLREAAAALPEASLPDLRKLRIFLLYGSKAREGGRTNGLEYFRASAPEHHDWLDPRMGRSIVIFNAENYVKLPDLWALKSIVHELAHAWHLEHWPELRRDIYDAWAHAVKAGLYREVRPEDRGAHLVNYAARNHLEYFAELSAMYFARANYFPRDRAGLRAYDPVGYALVRKLWGVEKTSKRTEAGGEERSKRTEAGGEERSKRTEAGGEKR